MLEDDQFWFYTTVEILRNRCVVLRLHFQYLVLYFLHITFF